MNNVSVYTVKTLAAELREIFSHLCVGLAGCGEQRLQLAVQRLLVLLTELLLELRHGSSGQVCKHAQTDKFSPGDQTVDVSVIWFIFRGEIRSRY